MKVVIVGAGIIGLNCAYYLNKKGVEVTVLDQGDVCSGASSKNACCVAISHIVPLANRSILSKGVKWVFNPKSPFYIKPRVSKDLLIWLLKFSLNTRQTHVEEGTLILKELLLENRKLLLEMYHAKEFEFPLWKQGLFYLYTTEKGKKEGEKLNKITNHHGVFSSFITKAELEKIAPSLLSDSLVASLYFPDDIHIDTELFVYVLANYLKDQGVHIQTNSKVASLQPIAKGSQQLQLIKESKESLSADAFVIANGAWTPQLLDPLGIKTYIQPAKGYSITFPAPERMPISPALLTESKVAITPLEDKLRLSGTLELAGYDASINQTRVQAIIDSIGRHLPHLNPPEGIIETTWSGYRPCTPTGLPLIGKTEEYENLFLATGHGMIGVSLANITGKLIQETICEG